MWINLCDCFHDPMPDSRSKFMAILVIYHRFDFPSNLLFQGVTTHFTVCTIIYSHAWNMVMMKLYCVLQDFPCATQPHAMALTSASSPADAWEIASTRISPFISQPNTHRSSEGRLCWYSISQKICTRFCCALLCCGYSIVHNEFTWSIYPFSAGLLCWHWGNR